MDCWEVLGRPPLFPDFFDGVPILFGREAIGITLASSLQRRLDFNIQFWTWIPYRVFPAVQSSPHRLETRKTPESVGLESHLLKRGSSSIRGRAFQKLRVCCYVKTVTLTLPDVALLAGTRAVLGAGVALLLADKLDPKQRQSVGWTLTAIGLLTTIPLALEVFGKTSRSV